MRRTSARQVELPDPLVLADARCHRCGRAGITLICLGTNDNGAIEVGFCALPCAKRSGWPPWSSEQPKARRKRA